ncbi:MAG: leucine-rich repeat domain-containing protein [Paraprevotella sp.]|nr:leucine-rich repeat domain-containing protein [Paraprevotella sp.]
MNKNITGVLALISCLLFLPIAAVSQVITIDGINYTTSGNQATVESSSCTGDIIIPSFITVDGENYTVVAIGDRAFENCYGLTSVTIPNTVTSIGVAAFYKCGSLASVTIPNSVKSIGRDAFYDCGRLHSVYIEDLVAWCNWEIGSYYSIPTCNYARLYLNGVEITDLVIPSSVTVIKSAAFCGCYGITSVTIPNTVTRIRDFAFENCSSLTSVTIPNSVTSIGGYAFLGCNNLHRVNIEDLAAWCNIKFNRDATSNPAHNGAGLYLNGVEIKDLVIPSSVTSIGEWAFAGCSGLTSVTIPNSVTSIKNQAFARCSGLTSVTIPNSVTSIESGVFANCRSLTSVTIPSSVTSIKNQAFAGCKNLESVYSLNPTPPICEDSPFDGLSESAILYVLGKRIEAYKAAEGWKEFSNIKALKTGCTFMCTHEGKQLKYIVLDANAMTCQIDADNNVSGKVIIPEEAEGYLTTAIGENAFSYSDAMTEITIPGTVKAVGAHAFECCTGLKSVYSLDMIPPACANDAFSGFNKSATLYVPGKAIEAYKAADGWKEFQNIEALKKGNMFWYTHEGKRLQYAVWDVDENTCKVANGNNVSGEVIIPAEAEGYTVTVVGDSAFCNNEAMTDVYIPKSVEIIGLRSFSGCNGLTSVTIPESVTEIGLRAFYNCAGVNTVFISGSVNTIRDYAFYGCRKLKSIYFMSLTPPELTAKNCFLTATIRSATLYVPNEAVEAYKSAEGWKDFQNIVGIDPTGIEDVKVTGESRKKENVIYDLSGRRLNQPKRGVNIVNGKKVMMNL